MTTINGNGKIGENIIIEEGKPEIDLSNWLNAVTNMVEVWQKIISEALTNRYGVFTYKYEDTISKEKDGELLYVKPYSIDLKISIGKTLCDLDGEEYLELNQLSKEQKERMIKLGRLVQAFDEYLFSGHLDIDKIKKELEEL